MRLSLFVVGLSITFHILIFYLIAIQYNLPILVMIGWGIITWFIELILLAIAAVGKERDE